MIFDQQIRREPDINIGKTTKELEDYWNNKQKVLDEKLLLLDVKKATLNTILGVLRKLQN